MKFLVIDDKPEAANDLAGHLKEWGHVVQCANDGPTALAKAIDFDPDVVLVDLELPGMHGYEMARLLRALERGGSTILVAFTDYGQKEDVVSSRLAGFTLHIVKPIPLAKLRELVDSFASKVK